MLALWENYPTRTRAACDQNAILFHCTFFVLQLSQQNTAVSFNLLLELKEPVV